MGNGLTGKLVAGPFESDRKGRGAVRFLPDSKKLAVESEVKKCLEDTSRENGYGTVTIGGPPSDKIR